MRIGRLFLLLPLLAGAGLCPLSSLGGDSLDVGTAAPPFTLVSTTEEIVSLSDLEGYVVLLNIWTPT